MKENMMLWFILAFIVVLCAYTLLLVRFFMKRISTTEKRNLIAKNSDEIMKLRFQAFERYTLLLERLSPESLILREQKQNMTGFAFHNQLLKSIRHEFNHNTAMQIYISSETWQKIKTAKEKLVALINLSLTKIKPQSSALEFGKIVIESATGEVNQYFKIAVAAIRDELEDLSL